MMMEKADIKDVVGKRVKITLYNDYYYSGYVLSVGDDYVKISDKYNKIVFIVLSEIKLIVETG